MTKKCLSEWLIAPRGFKSCTVCCCYSCRCRCCCCWCCCRLFKACSLIRLPLFEVVWSFTVFPSIHSYQHDCNSNNEEEDECGYHDYCYHPIPQFWKGRRILNFLLRESILIKEINTRSFISIFIKTGGRRMMSK